MIESLSTVEQLQAEVKRLNKALATWRHNYYTLCKEYDTIVEAAVEQEIALESIFKPTK